MARKQTLSAAFVAMVVTAGCGGSSSPSSATGAAPSQGAISTPASDEKQAIVQAVDDFAKATTAAQMCAVITRGLQASFGSLGAPPTIPPEAAHQAASGECPAVVASAVKAGTVHLSQTSVTVGKVLVQRDRAAAMVKEPDQERPYFLLNVSGRWLVNNFGSAPPDFTELGEAVRS